MIYGFITPVPTSAFALALSPSISQNLCVFQELFPTTSTIVHCWAKACSLLCFAVHFPSLHPQSCNVQGNHVPSGLACMNCGVQAAARRHACSADAPEMATPPPESNAGSDLLCNEDACACLYDDDDDSAMAGKLGENCNNSEDEEVSYDYQSSLFAQEESRPLELRTTLSELFAREKHYLPQPDFVLSAQSSREMDVASRRKAISWVLKMCKLFKFCAYTASLSVNYFDRFLSLHQLPSGRAWTFQLLSVACLSLAAKMEEIEVPLLLDLQVGAELVFEPLTIQRMELLVLNTLGWKMSSVTPISYLSFFLSRVDLDSKARQVLVSRVNELILSSTLEIRFLRFLPSSIAAAATLCAFQEILPHQVAAQRQNLLSAMLHQSQVELKSCLAYMLELFSPVQCLASKEGNNSVPQSPVAVLDASFSSNSISNATINCHTCLPISSPSPPKKRKMDASS